MFTGIIEETGYVKNITRLENGIELNISCEKVTDDIKIGDSISVNGCCQTVISFDKNSFKTQLSKETLSVTNFNELKPNDKVNLERALLPTGRLGGHIVQGHVDCKGKFIKQISSGNFYELYFEIPKQECKYLVHKGAVAINGVSLTVASIEGEIVKCAVIPYTFHNTNLSELKPAQYVNIETDILGRYIEKFLSLNNNSDNITKNFLQENGFL